MGLCQSILSNKELREQAKINREIEKTIAKSKKSGLDQKVLLLGPGESGKSTVLKQMIAMNRPYTEAELKERRVNININMYNYTKQLLEYAAEKCENFDKPDRIIYERLVVDLETMILKGGNLTPLLGERLKTFWRTDAIQQAFSRRHLFHLPESSSYFFENLDRICEPNFEPVHQDIVHIRMPTQGIVQVEVMIKNIRLTVFDCGGQRGERRKWFNFFEDVSAVLFVVAISEYDQMLAEDDKTNRMDESLSLFRNVFSSNKNFFRNSSIILFLNKIDLFREKVKTVPINKNFPKFEAENTAEHGAKFFRRMFRGALRSHHQKKLYTHETCAINDQVQMIINTVVDKVVQENLKDTGMI